MLVLTRKVGEWIEIGEDVRVHIIGFNGRQVRIGLEAPMDVKILRGELADLERQQYE